jgi:hypothetical protein
MIHVPEEDFLDGIAAAWVAPEREQIELATHAVQRSDLALNDAAVRYAPIRTYFFRVINAPRPKEELRNEVVLPRFDGLQAETPLCR